MDKHPSDYMAILMRRRRTIGAIVISALTVTFLLSILLPSYYESKVSFYVPIFQGDQVVLTANPKNIANMKVAIPLSNDAAVKGIAQILLSQKVRQRISEIVPEREPDVIRANTTVDVSAEGIFEVSVQDRHSEIAASIANAYPVAASYFIEQESGLGYGSTGVRAFVEEQLRMAQMRSDSIKQVLDEFLAEHGVLAVDQELAKILDLDTKLRTQKLTNQISLLENDAKRQALAAQMDLAGADAIDNLIGTNQVILRLRAQIASLEIQIAEKRQTFTEEHPEIIALRAAQAQAETSLRDEIEKVFESYTEPVNPIVGKLKENYIQLQIRRAVMLAQSEIIDESVMDLESHFLDLSQVQYEFARLRQEAMVARRLGLMLSMKLEETKFQEDQNRNRFVLLDEATPSRRPKYPNLFVNLLVSFGLAFLASTFLSLIWEGRESRMRERIIEDRTEEDLEGIFYGE